MNSKEIKINQMLRSNAFYEVLKKYADKIIVLRKSRASIDFVSKNIRSIVGLHGNGYGNWNGISDLFVYGIDIRKNYSSVCLIVGPSDNVALRELWIAICRQNPNIFTISNRDAEHWKGIYNFKFYEKEDYIENACAKLDAFLSTTFDIIDNFFKNFNKKAG